VIPPYKLSKLQPRQRVRKSALLLEEAERSLRGGAIDEALKAALYAASLASYLAADAEFPEALRPLAAEASSALAALARTPSSTEPGLRALNRLRHALLRESGQAPADWDLLDPASGRPDAASRRVFPGVRAYLEDIRSPFNVGSMLRSADAFGLEELILSPEAADPGHPRAARSSMGAADLVSWRRSGLEALDDCGGRAFALELGGIPLDEFDFPEEGIVVVGSEELGVSAEARAKCGLGLVSIPMRGAKGSLNVGVAFGILLNAWAAQLSRRAH